MVFICVYMITATHTSDHQSQAIAIEVCYCYDNHGLSHHALLLDCQKVGGWGRIASCTVKRHAPIAVQESRSTRANAAD